ncbi:hypothetical protein LTR99_009182 [Exophiala xenobiotica]|uniref:Thioredoxin n=1 Tax=Vermiconidia calcicola TaxID=1690605 RepID=A0AAV9Q3X5_9PEZI|nr:hypothetical protein LTR92_000928 [Exophiala xenobiotica]KAK5532448.1 hypothetical protein LTR25_007981 [Vermiconidia calcicola]KAK5533736.1 hypothetical protein LTR23_008988 [Chaetothyriales sp. CCFEE 6169]KAK5264976.1 hypothetical protein LTR96_009775 [Exophiala xenobiotica]KAK5295593.1 hypothetical protein LTR99_009182 [Exophiala xenobiotica]
MEVQLYVYDLSQGLARQYSRALTGVQIDAIYHTAIVLNNVEYFFGQGIHRKVPGSTHHGRPMQIVPLGHTDLPLDVIEEYIDSLQDIYTPESYDLFVHNCNNFTQDLAMFLVGKSIPEDIRSLPETFLRTPIGQMLRGQIDQSMRTMAQAPDAVSGRNVARSLPTAKPAVKSTTNGRITATTANGTTPQTHATALINAVPALDTPGQVHFISSLTELDRLLDAARHSCAVIFFTSATCPPCKIVYPTYDELAAEAGTKSGAKLIKIDISASPSAHAVAQRYQVRATPTFITFLKGQKQDEWSGANPAQLQGNVRLLLQMARSPQHQHSTLKLPTFQRIIQKPITYTRTPPLDKLLVKIGPSFSQHSSVQGLVAYIKAREEKGMTEAPLPNLHAFSEHLTSSFSSLPPETHFAVIDLVRCAAIDPRVSSFLAAEQDHEHETLKTLLTHAGEDFSTAPYNIQSVSLQLACNLFTSNVFQERLFHGHSGSPLRESIETLAAQCLLSPHLNARSMAAALVYNLAAYVHNARVHNAQTGTDTHDDDDYESAAPSDDLSAALLESITTFSQLAQASSTNTNTNKSTATNMGSDSGSGSSNGNDKEAFHALLLALGMLLYAAPPENMLWDLCRAMDLREVLRDVRSSNLAVKSEPLLKEVGDELLEKGAF